MPPSIPTEPRLVTDILAAHARRAVPRYTSYPTAPHFRPGFPSETYAAWLSGLDPAEPVSLYLHVPFCKQICWYCGCNMKLAARAAPVASYLEILLAEIALVADRLPGRMRVSHLHWGGGTPTTLVPDDLARAMELLRARFDLAPGAELAIETDPRTLTDEMIGRIGALGFTRASFGVQECDPKVQAAINRIQPPEMVARAVEGLRAAGIAGVNFDLIYGLPHQTVGTLLRTIALVATMRPERIALFGYAHVPWMAKAQRMIPEDALPGAAARAEQAARAAEALEAAGYAAIGLDHFALPQDAIALAAREGRLRRNFQGYTTDAAPALIGLGASSIGRMPQGYVQNIGETGAWARAVGEGRLPVAKGLEFGGEDRLRGHVIAAFGAAPDWWATEAAAIDRLAEDGLLLRSGAHLALTPDGRRLARICAAVFDRYLAQSEARHSVAV
jgi:oxygen-independent coproporphyrinogen III oxidase